MSSSDSESQCTPPVIQEVAESTARNLLPSKSKHLYEIAYQNFVKWRTEKNEITSENCLLVYFEEMSEKYKPTSLWTHYSMLKCMINVKENIDIGKFSAVTALLKNKSSGFQSKKASTLTTENVHQFLAEAPNEFYLATKVILIFGVSGACRVNELTNVRIQDIEEHGDLMLVKIPDTKISKPRSFIISAEYVKIVKQYQALRPKNVTCDRFFLNYQQGRCTNQVIGKNKISNMPKQIAAFLKLPNSETYTGHAFRRTSATLLTDAGASHILNVHHHGSWTSSKMVEEYVEESISIKTEIGSILAENPDLIVESASECNSPQSKRAKHNETTPEDGKCPPDKLFYLQNCNVTINYTK